jgi:hypothetical protein
MHRKTSVRVVEKYPDISVAAVHYTFTHIQYTEQHNETEYTERNIHNNKLSLCGCESWCLTLREERRLRVFENGVLRGIFGAKRDEVTVEWRKIHNEEFNYLYFP